MANGQTYNQYTKCVQPGDYHGVYIGGSAYWTGIIASLALLLVDPGAATLAAVLTVIGYCQWWLYARLVCLGQPTACFVGLVVRIDTQQDQSGLGKFDTDYTLYLLPAPNPLIGNQDYINKMNNPAGPGSGAFMQDQTTVAAPNPAYVQMRLDYTSTQLPFGFSGEIITGYDLTDHDGVSVMTAAQATALDFPTPPDWQPGFFYNPGTTIRDGNGGLQTAVDQGLSGSTTPSWPSPDLRNWQPTVGQTTNDYGTIWRYDGPVPAAGILEVEFEGAGVWYLYQAMLVAAPVAAAASVICAIPFIGWIACLIICLVVLVIAGIGAIAGLADNSAQGDVNNQVGNLQLGVDVLLVSGTWVWDGGHIPNGWNEFHPVLFAQRIAQVQNSDLLQGQPWQNLPAFGAATISDSLNGMCELVGIAQEPLTQAQQQLPWNGWQLHPLVDGCTPPPPPQNIQ